MKTFLNIRVQALGGMFLGPDSFGGAAITVTDRRTGKVLAQGMTDSGDSGTRVKSANPNSTRFPIVTPDPSQSSSSSSNSTAPLTFDPTVYWVTANPSTVKFETALQLAEPTLVEISARVPLPNDANEHVVSTSQWILPGVDQVQAGGIVLLVPGLWVQPEIVSEGLNLVVRAKVTMMCGCEINTGSPWVPGDFQVLATIKSLDPKSIWKTTLPLSFQANSQFYLSETVSANGKFEVRIRAVQHSTGNVGFATAEISV